MNNSALESLGLTPEQIKKLQQLAFGNLPDASTYGASTFNANAAPDWQKAGEAIPDWRAVAKQVQDAYTSAGQVALEDERMNREGAQRADLSSRGVLQEGFNPNRYWYAQKNAENNAAGLTAGLNAGTALRQEKATRESSLRSEALNQLLARYGLSSSIRGEASNALSQQQLLQLALAEIAQGKSKEKNSLWGDIFGTIGSFIPFLGD